MDVPPLERHSIKEANDEDHITSSCVTACAVFRDASHGSCVNQRKKQSSACRQSAAGILDRESRADQLSRCTSRNLSSPIACRLGRDALCLKDKRRDEMRRTPVALIVLVSSVSVLNLANPAKAASYPVCLAGGSDNALRCDYANFEECRATASGGLGYCIANLASVFNAQASYRGSVLWRPSRLFRRSHSRY
jgi:hypothetical protein